MNISKSGEIVGKVKFNIGTGKSRNMWNAPSSKDPKIYGKI